VKPVYHKQNHKYVYHQDCTDKPDRSERLGNRIALQDYATGSLCKIMQPDRSARLGNRIALKDYATGIALQD